MSMRIAVSVLAALAGVWLCLAGSAGRASAASTEIRAAAIVADLRAGRPIIREDTVVRGPLDLRELVSVRVPIVCRRCRFTGPVRASHVRFDRSLDLTGSVVEGPVDFEGARFDEPVLLASSTTPTTFRRSADFAFASFGDLADFGNVEFDAPANFSQARFEAASRFTRAAFRDSASFGDSRFDASSLFFNTTFTRAADFGGADFHDGDFRLSTFMGEAGFGDVGFDGRADFSRSMMYGAATFDDVRFGSDAIFKGTAFHAHAPLAASFAQAAVGGRLDFSAATIEGPLQLLSVSAHTLLFESTMFAPTGVVLYMNHVDVDRVVMSLDDVRRIDQNADQTAVLQRIEETAKDAGNLRLANDAHYQLHVLASKDDRLPRKLADLVLYRWVAGYLVRPLRPIGWLIGLIVLAAVLRMIFGARPAREGGRVRRLGRSFVRALSYTMNPKGKPGDDDIPSPARRVELGIYAFLLGCFLLALANTNPTLREMVDALL